MPAQEPARISAHGLKATGILPAMTDDCSARDFETHDGYLRLADQALARHDRRDPIQNPAEIENGLLKRTSGFT